MCYILNTMYFFKSFVFCTKIFILSHKHFDNKNLIVWYTLKKKNIYIYIVWKDFDSKYGSCSNHKLKSKSMHCVKNFKEVINCKKVIKILKEIHNWSLFE